jgi:glycosyltransferase involved in cell wall biosynthesis
MSETLVSAVVSVFNGERFLRVCLDSVLQQTYVPIEVIVVNDGSTDATAEILDEYSDRIQVIYQENLGQGAALNRAVAASKGELVAFLDCDDVWERNKIERQVSTLNRFPQALAVYCDHRNIDETGAVTSQSGAPGYVRCSGQILQPLIRGNFIVSPSTVMVRADAFRATGGFDEKYLLLGSKDYGLWLRLAARGPFIYQCETMLSYRWHGSSMSSSIGYRRIPSDLFALMGLEPLLREHSNKDVKTVYRERLYQQTIGAGWYYSNCGERAQALRHYLCAIKMRPWRFHAWFKLLAVALLPAVDRSKDARPKQAGSS